MICTTEGFTQPGCGVPADGHQPVSQPSLMQMPHALEALTNRDGHRHGLRLAGQLSEFLDELVGLGVLDVEAHNLPFYQKHGTKVAHTLGARSSGMIQAQDLTKIYGGKAAVDHLSFTVEPGRVTGFLGPNGAGKPVSGL